MITVKRLKELLEQLPDDARVWAYEGEKVGIGISAPNLRERGWFIVARETDEEDDDIEGFDDLQ